MLCLEGSKVEARPRGSFQGGHRGVFSTKKSGDQKAEEKSGRPFPGTDGLSFPLSRTSFYGVVEVPATPNWKQVVWSNCSPGRRVVVGKAGWLGESG